MYELIILARLMQRPAHGYLIAKIINHIIGPYTKMSNGRLYPLLARLEKDGLITIAREPTLCPHGGRPMRAYEITETGQKRFYTLMLDTTANPGEYQKIFAQKACYLHLLEPIERLHIIDHYITYCQTHIHHKTNEAEDIRLKAPGWGDEWEFMQDRVINMLHHSTNQWQLELAWATQLRDQEVATIFSEQTENTSTSIN
ncbi:hypothetical protein KDA_61460 [Dictyobacter alpinus]|uniref:Transcription regulator PadR N-terminal domain-containing protein n=1 Tax=Dictyobacter alpinus TaxID=2014873 RepID=A0A402BHE3_9CHLR|nr:helix-turn-helix transcriptional regulator [Dictyobacter alpinus]GCE30662.1 hypothetical protein KDA_61460 [Dictyobacter alpinus]